MSQITLPSGATVTLRDPKTFKQKDRRKLYTSVDADNAIVSGLAMFDNMIALLVEDWSFDLIPPSVKIESLDELSVTDYDALQAEAEEAMKVLFPKLNETSDDPKAPTAN